MSLSECSITLELIVVAFLGVRNIKRVSDAQSDWIPMLISNFVNIE